jgi:hypothetical protein
LAETLGDFSAKKKPISGKRLDATPLPGGQAGGYQIGEMQARCRHASRNTQTG